MRAVGLQWEYKWVSPEEMAAFKAGQAEQSEHKALTDGSQPAGMPSTLPPAATAGAHRGWLLWG